MRGKIMRILQSEFAEESTSHSGRAAGRGLPALPAMTGALRLFKRSWIYPFAGRSFEV
jgi:hypothetical protein